MKFNLLMEYIALQNLVIIDNSNAIQFLPSALNLSDNCLSIYIN